jgi:hypothetical protein
MLMLLCLSAFAEEPEFTTKIELDVRPQFWSNPDFDSSTDDQIWSVKQNARVGFAAKTDHVMVYTAVQDYRSWGGEASPFLNKDSLITMHEGYAQFFLTDSAYLKVGRQAYTLNDARLMFITGWTMFDRSYDGARFNAKGDKWENDLFVGIFRDAENFSTTCTDATDDGVDDCLDFQAETISSRGDIYLSNNLTLKISDAIQLSPYVLAIMQDASTTNPMQDRRIYNVGAFAKGKPTGEISYSAEGIYQFGQESADVEHSAWLGAATFGYHKGGKGVTAFYEESSGDGDATDTVNNDFDAFQGARHKFRGFADVIGASNVRDYGVKAKYKVNDKAVFLAHIHRFELSNSEGNWYELNGDAVGTPVAGNTDALLGHEVDLVVNFKPMKGVKFQLTEAIFAPSGYGAELTAGDLTTTTFLWMQTSL